MRCPDCSKFVSMDSETEPEVDNLEIDAEGHITASVRIQNNCADCGTTLKEGSFDVESDLDATILEAHKGEGHELSVETSSSERTQEGGGRYAKSYYGAKLEVTVECSCMKNNPTVEDQPVSGPVIAIVEMSDKVAASDMEEVV